MKRDASREFVIHVRRMCACVRACLAHIAVPLDLNRGSGVPARELSEGDWA